MYFANVLLGMTPHPAAGGGCGKQGFFQKLSASVQIILFLYQTGKWNEEYTVLWALKCWLGEFSHSRLEQLQYLLSTSEKLNVKVGKVWEVMALFSQVQ